MRCAQGMPLYWERIWDFEYNGGVSRFLPAGLPQISLSWYLGDLSTIQHDSAATFGAPTTDGRHTWITATAAGAVLGAGFNGGSDESYVRCGNPEQDGAFAGAVDTPMTCYITGEPTPYPMTFRVNAARFPYSTIEFASNGDSGPARSQVVIDGDGSLLSGGNVSIDTSVSSPFEARFTLAPGSTRQSTYYMTDGRLRSINIGIDGVTITQFCNAVN